MVRLSLPEIETLAGVGGYAGVSFLSGKSAATILSVAVWLHQTFNWIGTGYELTDDEKDRIDELVSEMEYEVMTSAIGQIIMNTNNSATPGTLLCDGTRYLAADYPELYDVIAQGLKIGFDQFDVPDFQNRFAIGANAVPADIAETGGESDVTLTESEMPAHIHQTTLRVGTGITVAPGTPLIVGGPVTVGTPSSSTGGGTSHNNIPPYYAVRFEIITGRE